MENASSTESKTTRYPAESRSEKRVLSQHIRSRQYQDFDSPRLSINNLMVITGICAVIITLMTGVGFFGVHAMLVISLVANWILANKLVDQSGKFRFWNQFIWAVLMPIVCIFGDPFIFGSFEFGRIVYISSYGYACYTFIAWQILILIVSWFIHQNHTMLNSFVSGSMLAGSLFSGIVAITILPITIFGLIIIGISAPGLIPWITSVVFLNSARFHWRRIADETKRSLPTAAVGFLLPIVLAFSIYAAALKFNWEYSLHGEFFPF